MSHGRFDTPLGAALTGAKDMFRKQPLTDRMKDTDRMDGKVCLITGANRGLGYGIATALAERGGEIIMACRSGIPEGGEQLKKDAKTETVRMIQVDLSDVKSIHKLCDQLRDEGVKLDVIVLNAGVALPGSRPTPQGQDTMFMVNYLSNFILVRRLLKDGTIPNDAYAHNGVKEGDLPRILFISSDSHQGASAIDYDEFGKLFDYGVKKAINNYSYFKLVLNTFATELSRRLMVDGKSDVSVNAMCPGPVSTDIAREAPFLLRKMLRVIFWLFFQAPKKAAKPVAYLCIHKDLEGTTNEYYHMFTKKPMDEKVYDEAEGLKLWQESEKVEKEIIDL